MRGTLAVVTAPTDRVLLAADVEAYARIPDVTLEMDHVHGLIDAATLQFQRWTNRQLLNATFRYSLDCFDGDEIYLPRPPLGSVTHVKYYDTSNVLQTISTSDYVVDADGQPGRVCLAQGKAWPATYSRPGAVVITYVAGYGAAATSVPANSKLGVKMLFKTWYDNPDAYATGTIVADLPMALREIIGGELIPDVG